MSSPAENKAKSVTQKLIVLAKRRDTSFDNLKTAFLIERLVARLVSELRLRDSLVFKGGFVGLRVYDNDRYTIDLDALLLKADFSATLNLTRIAAEKDLDDGAWFRFEGQINLATQGEYGGIRQTFRTGLGPVLKDTKKAQIIHFDLGIGDPVTPGPQRSTIDSFLTGDDLSWAVYPIETIIAEKLHAMIVRGENNSRSKDVYDLARFLPQANVEVLRQALANCFEFRKTVLPESFERELKNLDTAILEKGWLSAIASVEPAPKFRLTYADLIKKLGAIGL